MTQYSRFRRRSHRTRSTTIDRPRGAPRRAPLAADAKSYATPLDAVSKPNDSNRIATVAIAAPSPDTKREFYRPTAAASEPIFSGSINASIAPPGDDDEHDALRLTDIIGETAGEQIKSALASIGLVTLLFCFLQMFGGKIAES